MNKNEFLELAKSYNVIPVYERITGDMLTPVLAYLKLREKDKFCFLLESIEGIGRLARYSFIAKDPVKIISNRGMKLTITTSEIFLNFFSRPWTFLHLFHNFFFKSVL